MPKAGFKPTEVGVTGFQLNAMRMLYLQATTAGLNQLLIFIEKFSPLPGFKLGTSPDMLPFELSWLGFFFFWIKSSFSTIFVLEILITLIA